MPNWDTFANTGSVSWSDSYACAVFEASGALQYARGYPRNANGGGKYYFELKVNDAGGDESTLWLGVTQLGGSEVAFLRGGDGEQAGYWSGAVNNQVPGISTDTISSGDVWMVAINYDDPNDVSGSAVTGAYTTSLGYVQFGRNGTWLADGVIFGKAGPILSTGFAPVAIREATSTTAASVSLRLTAASLSYLPTGYLPWGTGTVQSPIGFKETRWDRKETTTTYTESQRVVYVPSGTDTLAARCDAKRKTGRAYWEWTRRTTVDAYDEVGTLGAIQFTVFPRLIDYSTSLTASETYVSTLLAPQRLVGGTVVPRVRSATISGSWTLGGYGFYSFYCDLDAGLVALADQDGTYARPAADTQGGDFVTRDKFAAVTISVSVQPSMGWGAAAIAGPSARYEINGGAKRFHAPLYPGWASWDGSRYNDGTGAHWDTDFCRQSVTYMNGDYTAWVEAATNRRVLRSQGAVSSGKRYFEFYSHEYDLGTSNCYAGLIQADALTHNSITFTTVVGAIWVGSDNGGPDKAFLVQNGVTLSATGSCTLSIGEQGGLYVAQGKPLCVAVDFDAGKAWFGNWNRSTRLHDWRGGDPVAGTGPHATFTASTTWYAAFGIGTGNKTRMTALLNEMGLVGDLPDGYDPWDGGDPTPVSLSATTTTSGTVTGSGGSGLRVIWPYGVQT